MVPRSLVGLDQNNILPRKCRSGRRYLPAPQDRPFKVGEYNVDAYERFNGSDGVFSGRLRCEIYQSRLFTSHQRFGMRVWQEDKLAFPLPFKDQCVWSQEVSFKFYYITVFLILILVIIIFRPSECEISRFLDSLYSIDVQKI